MTRPTVDWLATCLPQKRRTISGGGEDVFLSRVFDTTGNVNRRTEPISESSSRSLSYVYDELVPTRLRPAREPEPADDVLIWPSSYPRP